MKLWGWLDADHPDPIAGLPALDAWLAKQVGLTKLVSTPPVEFDASKRRRSGLTPAMRKALASAVGEDGFSEEVEVRAARSLGQSYPDQLERRAGKVESLADAVAWPHLAEEVASLMKAAARTGFRLMPAGGMTSATGGFRAADDGRPVVVVDLHLMNAIVEVSEVDRTVTAEAGIKLAELDEKLSHRNLTLGHYPQSFHGATLGGALMTNGSGHSSDQYGRIADNLISARIATPSGPWSTEAFRQAAAGPWTGGLTIGSEGLFGIMTDATLKLHDAPEHIEDRAWLLPSFEAAREAVRKVEQAGHELAMLRISDEAETAFVTGFRMARMGRDKPSYLEQLYLLLKRAPKRPCLVVCGYEGLKRDTGPAFRQAGWAFRAHGGKSLGMGAGEAWRKARYEMPYLRESFMARGLGVDVFETAAPWSKLGALHAAVTNAIGEAAAATLGERDGRPVVFCRLSHGYVEGASLYFTAIFKRNEEPLEQWRAIKKAATEAIIANGGALSHQHGMGALHEPWAAAEKGEAGVRLIEAVRRELDPKGVIAVGAARRLEKKRG
jgi:alkyldihydroxyacetonephosphate synthase